MDKYLLTDDYKQVEQVEAFRKNMIFPPLRRPFDCFTKIRSSCGNS